MPSLRSLGAMWAGVTNAPAFGEPPGAVASDVIEIKFFLDGAANTVTAAPPGFAVPLGAPQVNSNHSLRVYWAYRSDAGPGPYAFALASATHVEGRAAAIQGALTGSSPYRTGAGNFAPSTPPAPQTAPPVAATSTDNDCYASYAATNWSGGAWTEPAGFVEVMESTNRIITFDDKALPAPQTVTPQAVCANADKMCAWVGILLPSGFVPPVATAWAWWPAQGRPAWTITPGTGWLRAAQGRPAWRISQG